MVAEQILQRLEAEFDNPPEQIRAIADLLDADATPEFVALFRRDETGDPGEERITALAERLRFLGELEARKETLLQQAAERGHDVAELQELLRDSVDQDLLDDVDHYLRPHEHKAEAQVGRLGLGPLVEAIHRHELGDRAPQDAALEYVRADQHGMADADQVLAQVVLALAERYGEDPALRARVRSELARGILTATAAEPGGRPAPPASHGRADDEVGPVTEVAAEVAETVADDGGFADDGATPEESGGDSPALEGAPADAEASDRGAPEGESSDAGAGAADTAVRDVAAQDTAAQDTAAPDTAAQDTAAQDAAPQDAAAQDTTNGGPPADATSGGATTDSDAASAATTGKAATTDEAPRTKRQRRGKGGSKPGAGRYQQLLGIEEPVRRIPAGRMLALRRAEREGILQLRLVLPAGRELELFRSRFSPDVDPASPLGRFLDLVYGHAYDTYLHRPCEQTVRHHIKERADRETVRAFTRSLRAQLMAPVVEGRPVAALRVAGRSAWLAILDAEGATKVRQTLPIPDGTEGRKALVDALVEILRAEAPAVVGIPHGRREGPAKDLAREVLAALTAAGGEAPLLVPVDETAAVVWATSPQARRRHAQSDTGMRTTLSIARRLRDPLFELMRVEPRGLGLGQNLTEVHQGMLKRQLDATLTSCLARIGIDVNRADAALLARAPGVSRELAKAIVADRVANGSYKTLGELRRVPDVDDATFVRIAGFLRLRGGDDPFDATSVPPENRPLAERIAARLSVPATELIGHELRGVRADEVADDEFGVMRVRDTIDALRRGTGDPRGRIEPVRNQGVTSFDDLRADQQLEGRVTNLAEFGAFIDLGIGQDGLVHVSQIPGSRLRDPARILRVGEVVRVWVVHVDPTNRKIGLSMMKPRHVAEGRPATLGERLGGPGGPRRGGGQRGRREEATTVMNRAARAPEGRRGDQRRGPRPPRPKDDARGEDMRGDDRRGRPQRGGGRGGAPGSPRVITVESDKVQEAPRGHKGELRSLAGLKSLLPSNPPDERQDDRERTE